MKRVLIIIKGLGRGGAEQLLVNAAPHLDATRFEYECAYALPDKDQLAPELEKAGVPVVCLGAGTTASWIRGLRTHVRRTRPDLIHAHSPSVAAAARIALHRQEVRMVYTEHNVWQRYHHGTAVAELATYSRNDKVFVVAVEVR